MPITIDLILSLLILIVNIQGGEVYRKIINDMDQTAKCLDGTNPALYIHEGSDKNNILIVVSGGGFCQATSISQAIEQCYKRSKTDLGSSKNLADQLVGPGILTTDQSSLMSKWTKIFIPYCDGSLFQGYRNVPIKYKDAQLYFRGSRIMESHLQYINKRFNLSSKQKIVFSGFSAGGIAVTMWNQYLRKMVPQKQDNIYVIPDSGIFMNHMNYKYQTNTFQTQLKTLYSLVNLNQKTPIDLCNIDNPQQQWKCFLTQYNHKYLHGNFLFINSEYDSWAIQQILGLKCIKQGNVAMNLENCTQLQKNQIQQYRVQYDMLLFKIMQISDKFSFWSIGCSWHVYTMYDNIYNSSSFQISDYSAQKTVETFVLENQKIIKQDHLPWPSNLPCCQ